MNPHGDKEEERKGEFRMCQSYLPTDDGQALYGEEWVWVHDRRKFLNFSLGVRVVREAFLFLL